MHGSLRPLRVLGRALLDELRGRAAGPEQFRHPAHRPVDMVEEGLEARALVVEAGFAVGIVGEPVLRAAAVTGEPHVALLAEAWQRVALVAPELPLLRRGDQLDHVRVLDVAELERRLHEVVAGIEVARVLDREREPTRLRMHAEARRLAVPVGERDIEHLHEHLAMSCRRYVSSRSSAIRNRLPG